MLCSYTTTMDGPIGEFTLYTKLITLLIAITYTVLIFAGLCEKSAHIFLELHGLGILITEIVVPTNAYMKITHAYSHAEGIRSITVFNILTISLRSLFSDPVV